MARIRGILAALVIGGHLLHGQRLWVGPTGRDTALPAGKISVRFTAPAQWQRDTFLLIVRNAAGIVARTRLYPRSNAPHAGELSLSKPGYFVLLVHHPRVGGRIWASHRLYILAPPYTTIAQVRAYHNTLLARRASPTAAVPAVDDLSASLEDLISLTEPFTDAPTLQDLQIEEDPLIEDAALVPQEGAATVEEDEDLMDD